MFLNENVNMVSESVSCDPMYGMQLIQEASDTYNDLCMKMIKLEHTAIVSEDAALLEAGVKEYAKQFKEWAVMAARKFVEYLERVRVQWTKVQATLQSAFINTEAIRLMSENLGKAKKTVRINKEQFMAAVGMVEDFSSISKLAEVCIKDIAGQGVDVKAGVPGEGYDKQVFKLTFPKANKFESYSEGNESDVDVDKTLVNTAINYIKKRPFAVKNLQVAKASVTKICNEAIKKAEAGKTAKRNSVTMFQKHINKLIIDLNKATSVAVKICKVAKGSVSSEQRTQARKDAFTSSKNVKAVNESVLDHFA